MRHTIMALAVAIAAVGTAQAEDKQLLWGDTHLHTTYSSDAFANNNLTAGPETAYRYAKGIPVVHPGHKARVQIETPLDFLVVSDHAEFMGVIRHTFYEGVDTEGLGVIDRIGAWIAEWVLRGAIEKGEGRELFVDVLPEPEDDAVVAARSWIPEIGAIPPQPEVEADAWRLITEAADFHNEPGEFTALIGWEFSSTPGGANLHRIVLGDLDGERARSFVPFGIDNSVYPEDLWQWLSDTSEATGATFLAIPHNSNISKGAMFDNRTLRGASMTPEYIETRRYWEPIMEVTQIKGDSETHPALSPDDAFADFEDYPYYIQKEWGEYRPQVGDFARSALKRGLEIEREVGNNPYQFGMIGSTDAHTSLPSAEENNFHGKMATDSIPANKAGGWSDDARGTFGWAMSAQGLAAVWAEENTREAIVAAMRRREVYATTGPRIGVRVYGGWDLSAEALSGADYPAGIQERAVPMGGELSGAPEGAAPVLLIEANADPNSGTLDRVQVIKGWIDAAGATHEQIFDVAWSGDDRIAADGSLIPVTNTVDLETGAFDPSTGAAALTAAWRDPQFDPGQSAFYYIRVLEIPTPRHSLLDKLALNNGVDTRSPNTLQERAYTSPIWYRP
jgi:hypothetical protein